MYRRHIGLLFTFSHENAVQRPSGKRRMCVYGSSSLLKSPQSFIKAAKEKGGEIDRQCVGAPLNIDSPLLYSKSTFWTRLDARHPLFTFISPATYGCQLSAGVGTFLFLFGGTLPFLGLLFRYFITFILFPLRPRPLWLFYSFFCCLVILGLLSLFPLRLEFLLLSLHFICCAFPLPF